MPERNTCTPRPRREYPQESRSGELLHHCCGAVPAASTPPVAQAQTIHLFSCRERLQASRCPAVTQALELAEKVPTFFVIPSEARNLSFFSWALIEERFLASLGMAK